MKKIGNLTGIILCIILGFVIVLSAVFFCTLSVFSKDKLNSLFNLTGENIVYRDRNGDKYSYYEDLIRDFNRYSFTTSKTEILLESSVMKDKIAIYLKETLSSLLNGEKITSDNFKSYFIENMDDVFKSISLDETDKKTVIGILQDHSEKLFEKNVYKYVKDYELIGKMYGIIPKIILISSIVLLGFLSLLCFESIKKGFKALGIVFGISGFILLLFSMGIDQISVNNFDIDTEMISISFSEMVKELFRGFMPYGISLLLIGIVLYIVFSFTNYNNRLFRNESKKMNSKKKEVEEKIFKS